MASNNRGRHGRIVECPKCGRDKAPVGRSLPMVAVAGYCTWDSCDAYHDDPKPDYLFPSETEADFGYGWTPSEEASDG